MSTPDPNIADPSPTMIHELFSGGFLELVVLCLLPLLLYFVYRTPGGRKPNLYYIGSPFTDHVIKRCPRLSEPFRPAPLAKNRHLQTLLPGFLPRPSVVIERECVDLPDGGCCALDWIVQSADVRCRADDARIPVFIVLPGLTGDARSASHLCRCALERGYRPVVFNKRGHGGSRLRTPKLQSFGDPEDFRLVVRYIRDRYPEAALTAFGSSAGSGLLVSYLGEYGRDCMLSFAVVVSPGYDAEYLFKNCIRHPYDYLLVSMLKNVLSRNRDILAKSVDMDKVMRAKSLITVEQELYCTLYGYSSMDEYWKHNNPVRNPANIAIPVLAISSLDDPICTKECIQYSLFSNTMNQSILVTTEDGGHCGFLEGWNFDHWADKVGLDYLDAALEYCKMAK